MGSITIWQPRDIYHTGEPDESDHPDLHHQWAGEDNFRHGFTLHCTPHLIELEEEKAMENKETLLKTVLLLPTVMNKVHLESEGSGDVEFDGQLIENLELVELRTWRKGSILAKDVCANEIKLVTGRGGHIICNGILEGDLEAETELNGDIMAQSIGGQSVKITTEDGNISVGEVVRSEESKFDTQNGLIAIHGTLYGYSEFLLRGIPFNHYHNS